LDFSRRLIAFLLLASFDAAVHMSKKSMIAIGVLATLTVYVAVLPKFIRARETRTFDGCSNHLRQIEGAKNTWALETHPATNAVPTWDDLRPYLTEPQVCPQGGSYTLHRVSEAPKCSIGGDLHTL
jgi:hypothetical protein